MNSYQQEFCEAIYSKYGEMAEEMEQATSLGIYAAFCSAHSYSEARYMGEQIRDILLRVPDYDNDGGFCDFDPKEFEVFEGDMGNRIIKASLQTQYGDVCIATIDDDDTMNVWYYHEGNKAFLVLSTSCSTPLRDAMEEQAENC